MVGMDEDLPPDPFPVSEGEHPLLQVMPFGMAFGHKDFGAGIVKVVFTVQTFYGDLHFYIDPSEARTFGEAFIAEAAFAESKGRLWTPG